MLLYYYDNDVSGKNNLPRERKPTKVGYLFLRFCQKYYDAGRAPPVSYTHLTLPTNSLV